MMKQFDTRKLILIRGVSGSGKTKLATTFEDLCIKGKDNLFSDSIVTTSADDYFTDNITGEYKFDHTKLKEAHIECRESVKLAMYQDINYIMVHNTFTEEWEMKPYFDLAKEESYEVITLIVENRHNSKSIHNVPDEVIENQKKRFNIKL